MNKLLGLFFVFFFLSMNLCFAVDKQEFFVIKNSKIIKLEIDGQHQLAFQGDIKIIYDSDSTYLEYLNQKIKLNLDFSDLIEKNKVHDNQGLEAHLFNQALVAIQAQPYVYLKQVFQFWHQSTITLSSKILLDQEMTLSEVQIQNQALLKNDRFLSFEKILIQLTLHYFSTKNLQKTADRLKELVDLKVDKTLKPAKKQFGFIHSKESDKEAKSLSNIGFVSSSNKQTVHPQGFIGFTRPSSQCRLMFN